MKTFVENVTMTDDELRLGLYVRNCDGKTAMDGLFTKE